MIPEEWLPVLTRPGVQKFLWENVSRDVYELTLAGKTVEGAEISLISRQIHALQKARHKLPEWYSHRLILPPPEYLEQSSSQATASYKAGLLRGKNLVDLSGGTGVDTYYLSRNFGTTTYIEPNPGLCAIAEYNFAILGAEISIINSDAESFLAKNTQTADCYYVDPSRRDTSRARLYRIEDCSPNAATLKELLPRDARLLVKLSPMLDISQAHSELGDIVEAIHIVSVHNEVKELLFILGEKTISPPITATNLISGRMNEIFSFNAEDERDAQVTYSECRKYIYESNAAIRKAGSFNFISSEFGLSKLGVNTHLYTSSNPVENFPGRIINVEWHGAYHPGRIKKIIGAGKANIQARNFPDDVALIRKKTGIKAGGELYLFFYRDLHGKPVFAGGTKTG